MIQTADTVVSAHLDPGERLLWTGQPRSGIRLRGSDIFLIPFSLVWGGFAIFWEYMALTSISKAPGPVAIIFPLFGLPFVLVGLYLIFGRFFVDARSRARTFYGITNERVIIVSGLFSQQIKSLDFEDLREVSLTQHSDGSGTITLGPTHFPQFFNPGGAWPGSQRYAPPALELVDDAKEAYDLLRTARKTRSTTA